MKSKQRPGVRAAVRRVAITLVAVAALAGSAYYAAGVYEHRQPYLIGLSPGGGLFQFLDNYDELRRSGRDVRIDGICISACTFVVGAVPWERICVTPFAKLAFHSASNSMGSFSKEGTRLMWHAYPKRIRELLKSKFDWDGESEHAELMYVEGEDLRELFRSC